MSKLYEDTMQGLLEAIAIKNGDIPLECRDDMPGTTYCTAQNATVKSSKRIAKQ